ncbi:hypothetical protein CY34DRAFT_623441 [Suillus luteus UH-Slu-Lm8-n1]|uniref:Uncharacterized protein n=1 Tax=Suillus luteus UH-Slu-Lm8-n1 TaxID=930992 RepID=A0A0D0BE39_9AGAM|nr:hypothetical protein CY34DRAFT_623441 [Suillus luteus UH-Slu-Lm8-n1]
MTQTRNKACQNEFRKYMIHNEGLGQMLPAYHDIIIFREEAPIRLVHLLNSSPQTRCSIATRVWFERRIRELVTVSTPLGMKYPWWADERLLRANHVFRCLDFDVLMACFLINTTVNHY